MNLSLSSEDLKDAPKTAKHVLANTVMENALYDFTVELPNVHRAITEIMEMLVDDELSISSMQYEVTNILMFLHFEEKLGTEMIELDDQGIASMPETILTLMHILGKHSTEVRAGFEKAGFSAETLDRLANIMQEKYQDGET